MERNFKLALCAILSAFLLIAGTLAASPFIPVQAFAHQIDTQTAALPALEDALPFGFVNLPWSYVEGQVEPDAWVQASLLRGGEEFAAAEAAADGSGHYLLQFLQGGSPILIQAQDVVSLTTGSQSAEIEVVAIQGTIQPDLDTVSGQMNGGVFPSVAQVGVGRAVDTDFEFITATVNADGTFIADFNGAVDLDDNTLAKVWYSDPNGNQVRKVIYGQNLDVRLRMTESLIEGVTRPGQEVDLTLADSQGTVKQQEVATADASGYYFLRVLQDGVPASIQPGDQVTATTGEKSAHLQLNLVQVTSINPDDDSVSGHLTGGVFPASGKVDLWNAATNRWFYQPVTIDANGDFSASFAGQADLSAADRVRVHYNDPNGNQIAALTSGLELGASLTSDEVWGYTREAGQATITVYSAPGGSELGTQNATADEDGYFRTAVGDPPLDLIPGQQIAVQVAPLTATLDLPAIQIRTDFTNQTLRIQAQPGRVVQVSLKRAGASYWNEFNTDAAGQVFILFDPAYVLKPSDRLDLSMYDVSQGQAVEQSFELSQSLFLPILLTMH